MLQGPAWFEVAGKPRKGAADALAAIMHAGRWRPATPDSSSISSRIESSNGQVCCIGSPGGLYGRGMRIGDRHGFWDVNSIYVEVIKWPTLTSTFF
jgi:hypothetical protein